MSSDGNDLETQLTNVLLTTDSIGQAVIEVEESEGTVTLIGSVESESNKFAVEALVRQQDGVTEVINNLAIASSQADQSL